MPRGQITFSANGGKGELKKDEESNRCTIRSPSLLTETRKKTLKVDATEGRDNKPIGLKECRTGLVAAGDTPAGLKGGEMFQNGNKE